MRYRSTRAGVFPPSKFFFHLPSRCLRVTCRFASKTAMGIRFYVSANRLSSPHCIYRKKVYLASLSMPRSTHTLQANRFTTSSSLASSNPELKEMGPPFEMPPNPKIQITHFNSKNSNSSALPLVPDETQDLEQGDTQLRTLQELRGQMLTDASSEKAELVTHKHADKAIENTELASDEHLADVSLALKTQIDPQTVLEPKAPEGVEEYETYRKGELTSQVRDNIVSEVTQSQADEAGFLTALTDLDDTQDKSQPRLEQILPPEMEIHEFAGVRDSRKGSLLESQSECITSIFEETVPYLQSAPERSSPTAQTPNKKGSRGQPRLEANRAELAEETTKECDGSRIESIGEFVRSDSMLIEKNLPPYLESGNEHLARRSLRAKSRKRRQEKLESRGETPERSENTTERLLRGQLEGESIQKRISTVKEVASTEAHPLKETQTGPHVFESMASKRARGALMPRPELYPPPPMVILEDVIQALENIIDYQFKDPYYGWHALQGTAYDVEFGNRRLALLGDSLLRTELITRWLATGTSLAAFGKATHQTSNAELAAAGRNLGINTLINQICNVSVSRDKWVYASLDKPTPGLELIADTVEAIIGAVYLDSGQDSVNHVIKHLGILSEKF